MSEMSREDAIKRMRLMKYCEIEQSLTDHVTACEQAISDMEKLQRIEDALGKDCLSNDIKKCNFDGTCDEHKVSVIERILRGE